jgi:hypothetical protein
MTAENVITFEPRRQPVPLLTFCEIGLNEEDCSLTLSAHYDTGDVVTLEYKLATKPPEPFLDELRAAWNRWRGSSTRAS